MLNLKLMSLPSCVPELSLILILMLLPSSVAVVSLPSCRCGGVVAQLS